MLRSAPKQVSTKASALGGTKLNREPITKPQKLVYSSVAGEISLELLVA